MTLAETARAIRAEVLKAETALAEVDRLANDALRSAIGVNERAKAEAALARSIKAVNALHRAIDKAAGASGGVMPTFGK